MLYINEEIQKHHNEYIKLLKLWDEALNKLEKHSNIFNKSKLQKQYEAAGKLFNDFSENVYAKVIYNSLSKTKPKLVRIKTNKIYEWDTVFKDSFNKLDKLDRSILVGIVEKTGGYRII